MNTRIRGLQDEAEMAYNRLPGDEAGVYLQASLQAEIALQLGRSNELQEKQNELLLRLCLATEALNPGR